jgi:hypothetical protein
MRTLKPKRRWWQFSLRSLLLLTLAVGLWLGFEVRQARQVERTVAALSQLGGDAECEPTGWSLLRLCGVPGHGQCIVRAVISGGAVDEAIELLRGSQRLREVEVVYDGTFDPAPSWRHVRDEFHQARIRAASAYAEPLKPVEGENDALQRSMRAHLSRVKRIVEDAYPHAGEVREIIELGLSDHGRGWWHIAGLRYEPIVLADGRVAELFVSCPWGNGVPGGQRSFALLIVADRCISAKGFSTSTRQVHQFVCLEDLDHDGFVDIAFQDKYDGLGRWRSAQEIVGQLSGDPRLWVGAYKIESDGFKSLLAEDRSDFP